MKSQDNILLFHGGGLGDLVLAADLIRSIRQGRPHATLFLACREPVAGIAALMPSPPHHVIPIRLNSYLHETPTPRLLSELAELCAVLAEIQPSVLLAGDYQATWLTWFLAAFLRPPRSIGYLPEEPPRGLLPCLLDEFSLEPPAFENCGGGTFAHETERYAGLSRQLGVEPLQSPKWALPEDVGLAAADCLRRLELESGNYLACFPFGAVAEKCWPPARFREALDLARAEFGVPVLLLGSRAEEAGIEDLRSSLPTARTFIGDPSDLPVVAGLVAQCRAWFGNDTGPMHLGQAYRRPGVAVFGGGAGTVYSPWTAGVIGLIHPLPCFGCLWDCTFGHGECVESIPVEPVANAIREVLRAAPAQAEIRTLDFQPAGVMQLIGHAEARYRAAARDRKQRFEVLVELRREADKRLESSKRTALELTAGLQELQSVADTRERALIEKDAAMEQMRSIAEERAQALVTTDAAREQMRYVAEERGQALLEKDAALEQMRRIAEERALALQEKQKCIERLAAEVTERQRIALELDAALQVALDASRDEEPETSSDGSTVEAAPNQGGR